MMAKVLKQFDFGTSNGFAQRYPWDDWADGKIRELTKGEDFSCKPQTFAMMARKHAKKAGLQVRISTKDEGKVVVQFQKPTKSAE